MYYSETRRANLFRRVEAFIELRIPFLKTSEAASAGKTSESAKRCRTAFAAAINIFSQPWSESLCYVYAFSVHWLIAPVYFSTIPILGILSSVLGKKSKTIQKTIVAETTGLAGSTTESLRNIELVKSLGLAQQEIERLNNVTGKY